MSKTDKEILIALILLAIDYLEEEKSDLVLETLAKLHKYLTA